MCVTSISNSRTPFPYELKTFTAEPGVVVSDQMFKWGYAVILGFYGKDVDPALLRKVAESEARDGRVYTGAYLDQSLPGAWDASYPVSTYAYHRKTLNVGAGALLPVHMITAVTVRPSHRRRGLLKAMMTADLAQAKADGLPMAALTASEATIYSRYGFGVATRHATVEVDAGPGFGFHQVQAAQTGVVEVADAGVLVDLEPKLFEKIHAGSFGSIDRQDSYRYKAAGQWSYENPDKDKGVRAALHYGDDGTVDGYVSYKFEGWDSALPAVSVVDLLATSDAAYLALWNYLGSLDLVKQVKWQGAPLADPLAWALANSSGYARKRVSDHLWLRILDVPAALEARHYWGDGTVVLRVNDPLGHASGTFQVDATGGRGVVSALSPAGDAPGEAAVDVELGVAELSSLYLADVSAQTMAAAGRLHQPLPGGAALFDSVFSTPVRAHSQTDF